MIRPSASVQMPGSSASCPEDAGADAPDERSALAKLRGTAQDLISLTKPRLSSLVLVTAGGGLWLSGVEVPWWQAMAAIGGTTMVVGGANALNNYIERESDREMARTARRPLPARRLSPTLALAFGVALSLVSIPLLAVLTTPLAALLAAGALVLYVFVYTPLKRRSSISTLIGAIPGALPPLIGWTAATGTADLGGLVLFALLFLWQIPHSLAIGIYRRAEYEAAGLVVFPTEHGEEATRRQMLLYTLPLVPMPAVLAHVELAGPLTMSLGSLLGFGFLWLAWQGYRDSGGAKWARKLFFYSLIYLTGIFFVLTVDQWL